MAKEPKQPEWLLLQSRWGNEQLIKRWHRGETTETHNITRLLEWMSLVIHAALHEYKRREVLAQQVADLSQQIVALKQELEIVKDVIRLEIVQDVTQLERGEEEA